MFLERLLNQGNAPLAEQMLRFTAARHELLAANVANASTPDYRNTDLDVTSFQAMLQDRVAERKDAPPGSVSFDDISAETIDPNSTLLFHDRNNRSMEQLVADSAKNALMHNLVVELMKRQYGSIESALKERIA
jgi:flagellar basal-body rod protein FlgB